MLPWWLKIGHSSSIYTVDRDRCHKSGLLFLKERVANPALESHRTKQA